VLVRFDHFLLFAQLFCLGAPLCLRLQSLLRQQARTVLTLEAHA
jgi:hypothetical protein